jgi:hypothetical protein
MPSGPGNSGAHVDTDKLATAGQEHNMTMLINHAYFAFLENLLQTSFAADFYSCRLSVVATNLEPGCADIYSHLGSQGDTSSCVFF